MILLLKAQIKGGAHSDLFATPVMVAGYVREGHFVKPHIATRKKAPQRAPMSDAAAEAFAHEVLAHNAARRKAYGKNPPLTSPAGWVSAWAHDAGRRLSDDDEGKIVEHVFRVNRDAANKLIVLAHPKAMKPTAIPHPDPLVVIKPPSPRVEARVPEIAMPDTNSNDREQVLAWLRKLEVGRADVINDRSVSRERGGYYVQGYKNPISYIGNVADRLIVGAKKYPK